MSQCYAVLNYSALIGGKVGVKGGKGTADWNKGAMLGSLKSFSLKNSPFHIYIIWIWLKKSQCQLMHLFLRFLWHWNFPEWIICFFKFASYSQKCPFLEPLSFPYAGKGRGPNRVPIYGLLALGLISIVFILVGGVNSLGPIVTMPFMITYAAVDYAFFALAMSPAARGMKSGRGGGGGGGEDGDVVKEEPVYESLTGGKSQ